MDYKKFFNLNAAPFTIAPNPHYLFMSQRHQEALAHLLYGLESGGFVLLTGEIGTGKTTLCRHLLNQIPDNCEVAFILNPMQGSDEMLVNVCRELHIDEESADVAGRIDAIYRHLLSNHAANRHTLIIIDEAQNLSEEVLEQLRLLTNLETDEKKLLQIILLGQPELRDKLQQVSLHQLSQRIIARYHLMPLSEEEVESYVRHRLSVAGVEHPLFDADALKALYRHSRGVPRLINIIADRAMLGAYSQGERHVGAALIHGAAAEVLGRRAWSQRRWSFGRWLAAASMAATLLAAVGALLYFVEMPSKPASQVSTQRNVEPGSAPPSSPLSVPEQIDSDGARALAFTTLFALWNVNYDIGRDGDACLFAARQRMQCLEGVGDLDLLRRYDRPAVLNNVRGDDGRMIAVGLLGFDAAGRAIISVGSDQRQIAPDLLQERWFGAYSLPWRPPRPYTIPFREGDRGAIVPWLASKRARLSNQPVQASWALEGELLEWLREFQVRNNILDTGAIDPPTLVMLQNALRENHPQLIDTLVEEGG